MVEKRSTVFKSWTFFFFCINVRKRQEQHWILRHLNYKDISPLRWCMQPLASVLDLVVLPFSLESRRCNMLVVLYKEAHVQSRKVWNPVLEKNPKGIIFRSALTWMLWVTEFVIIKWQRLHLRRITPHGVTPLYRRVPQVCYTHEPPTPHSSCSVLHLTDSNHGVAKASC
jgi:hypothetical protein